MICAYLPGVTHTGYRVAGYATGWYQLPGTLTIGYWALILVHTPAQDMHPLTINKGDKQKLSTRIINKNNEY